MSFYTNGRENSNVHNFLPDLHNNPFTFFKSSGLYLQPIISSILHHFRYTQQDMSHIEIQLNYCCNPLQDGMDWIGNDQFWSKIIHFLCDQEDKIHRQVYPFGSHIELQDGKDWDHKVLHQARICQLACKKIFEIVSNMVFFFMKLKNSPKISDFGKLLCFK